MNISDFNITRKSIPEKVADKILKWHLRPLELMNNITGRLAVVSARSSYRPLSYEKARGRSGNSEHCYKVNSKGATDITGYDLDELLEDLIEHTDYTRLAVYKSKGFIHCDYKYVGEGKRVVFNEQWSRIKTIKL